MSAKLCYVICMNLLISLVRCDSLFTPCTADDNVCLKKCVRDFISHTYMGIPKYNMQRIDPLTISHMDYEANENSGLKYHFKNLNVGGLKNLQFSDLKIDKINNGITWLSHTELNIAGAISMKLSNDSKTFNENFTLSASVSCCCKYGFHFKEDSHGETHYEIGPETITCQVSTEPELIFDPELNNVLNTDSDVAMKVAKEEILMHKDIVISLIAEKSYVAVVHNVRAAARLLEKTSFLLDD